MIKFYKCDSESRPELDRQNCAIDIDDWLYDKMFEPYVFQQKIEFDNFDFPINEQIERRPGVPLSPTQKSTIWARMREHKIDRKDHWYQLF